MILVNVDVNGSGYLEEIYEMRYFLEKRISMKWHIFMYNFVFPILNSIGIKKRIGKKNYLRIWIPITSAPSSFFILITFTYVQFLLHLT